jgi:hypothetical protein
MLTSKLPEGELYADDVVVHLDLQRKKYAHLNQLTVDRGGQKDDDLP